MAQNTLRQNNGKHSKKRYSRKKNRTGLLVFTILVLLLLIIALLLGTKNMPAPLPVSSPSLPPQAAASTPPSQQASSETTPPVVGKYDVEGTPPLFNPTHFIPSTYVLNLTSIGGEYTMQAPASIAFNDMVTAANADGITIYPISGYRSHEHQTANYNTKIQSYLAQNYSKDEAIRRTKEYIAIPGTSEHEAGLAVDVNSLNDSFDQTPEFAWLQEHAAEYGFIFRYQKNTQDITGIAYEPWHYRFVGTNHAARIAELGNITLEEYISILEK